MPPLRISLRVKIRDTKEYAGMMELVDMRDLATVTSVTVFTPADIANRCAYWCANPFS